MNANDFKQPLMGLLAECYGMSDTKIGFFLENGRAGLFGQLDRIDAALASARTAPDNETIASHCRHLLYTFKVFMSFENGEQFRPDWASSWVPDTVDESEWAQLKDDLMAAYTTFMAAIEAREEWPSQAMGAGMSMLAHTTYHVGVIDKMITETA